MTNENLSNSIEIEKYTEFINEIRSMELKLSGYLGALGSQSQMNTSHIVNMKRSEEKGYKDLQQITENSTDIATLAKKISDLLFSIKKDMEYTSTETRNSTNQLSQMSKQIIDGTQKLKTLQSMLKNMISLSNNVRDNITSLEDISARIDVLSINASIEAARAGSYGAGFKVVATEIKKLSVASKVFSTQITKELNIIDSHNLEVQDAMNLYGVEQQNLTENLIGGATQWTECDTLISNVLVNINNISELTTNQNENIDIMKSKAVNLLEQNKQNLRASNLVEKSLIQGDSILSSLTNSNDELRKKINKTNIRPNGLHSDQANKTIRVGHDLAYPPWVYLHNGMSAGLSVDYCKQIMANSEFNIEFEPGKWGTLLEKLENGEIDLIANVGWPTKFLKDGPYCVTKPYASFDVCYFQSDEWVATDKNYSVTCKKGSFTTGFIPKGANFFEGEDNDILNFVQLVWKNRDRVMAERRVGEYISKNYFEGQIKSEDHIRGSIEVVFVCHERNKELRDKVNEIIKVLGPIK